MNAKYFIGEHRSAARLSSSAFTYLSAVRRRFKDFTRGISAATTHYFVDAKLLGASPCRPRLAKLKVGLCRITFAWISHLCALSAKDGPKAFMPLILLLLSLLCDPRQVQWPV